MRLPAGQRPVQGQRSESDGSMLCLVVVSERVFHCRLIGPPTYVVTEQAELSAQAPSFRHENRTAQEGLVCVRMCACKCTSKQAHVKSSSQSSFLSPLLSVSSRRPCPLHWEVRWTLALHSVSDA